MAVIIMGGEFRGRKLATDSSSQIIRPTSGKVREALFSSLGEQIVGKTFVDLYAGTGAVGFEAVSRGAKEVFLVEKHPKSCALIKANLKSVFGNLSSGTRVNENLADTGAVQMIHSDALAFCRKMHEGGRVFPFIFADPPFADDFTSLYEAIFNILQDTGTGIIQYPSRNPPKWVGQVSKLKRYGESTLAYLTHPE
jgi:16S rRNA (guanine966-N2)-methyltransferase